MLTLLLVLLDMSAEGKTRATNDGEEAAAADTKKRDDSLALRKLSDTSIINSSRM